MKLTEQEFWDDYWTNIQLPSQIDHNNSFERCLAEALNSELNGISGDVLEVLHS